MIYYNEGFVKGGVDEVFDNDELIIKHLLKVKLYGWNYSKRYDSEVESYIATATAKALAAPDKHVYIAKSKRGIAGKPAYAPFSGRIEETEETIKVATINLDEGLSFIKMDITSSPKQVMVLTNLLDPDEEYEYPLCYEGIDTLNNMLAIFIGAANKQETLVCNLPDDDSEVELVQTVNKINRYLKDGKCRLVRCVDCKQVFILAEGEIQWFNAKGFALPKRCAYCRAKKKRR